MRTFKGLFTLAILFFCFTVTSAQSANYSVQAGETLYSIATKYGITVEQLVQANPGITPEKLKAGTMLTIPKAKASIGIANSDCREMHRVKKGETIYGISSKYGITEEQLLRANPEIKVNDGILKKGMLLCIPFQEAPTATLIPTIKKQEVKVSVLLPLKEENEAGQRCAEFYRGFIMGAERLANEGYNIVLNAVNEPANSADASSVLNTVSAQNPDFIVGPLYPSHFESVSAFSQQKKVRVFIPFSSKTAQVEQNKYLYMVNAPENYKAFYGAQLLKKSFPSAQFIFLASTASDITSFSQQLKEQMRMQKLSVADFSATKILLEWKAQLKNGRKNIFFTDTDKSSELQRIAEIVAQLKATYPTYDISLVAGSDALQQAGNMEQKFFAADTYFMTPSYFNTYSTAGKQFAIDYRTKYNTTLLPLAPSMAALGYDLAYQVIKQVSHYDKDYATQVLSTTPYQTLFHFRPTNEKGGYVNGNMLLIHYKKDGTIDQISL